MKYFMPPAYPSLASLGLFTVLLRDIGLIPNVTILKHDDSLVALFDEVLIMGRHHHGRAANVGFLEDI
jgi:hypothetical protein